MTEPANTTLTAVPGFKVGHWTDLDSGTGCTVVLCPTEGAVAGVDVRGGAPGSRETALLDPTAWVEHVHAVLLTGGSAFGLAAADGVMRWLESKGIGLDTGVARVPIVPAAVVFDLPVVRADVRPGATAGHAACEAATDAPVPEGNVGAGTGCSCGKVLGFAQATKTGLGSAAIRLWDGLIVGALAVVNALGNVREPSTGRIIAGARLPSGEFADTLTVLSRASQPNLRALAQPGQNTTLAVVATNARLTKTQATKVAQMAHNGLARTIYPVHTLLDGDTVFVLSHGEHIADVSLIGELAAEALAQAVMRAVWTADSLGGLPCAREVHQCLQARQA
ncbi:MAG: P1 family peptidase [Thermoflexales bacterium]|nr:P1 family peptidase [Thermoflexales bacterium]